MEWPERMSVNLADFAKSAEFFMRADLFPW
jgi:hypothetical protein